MKSVWGSEPNSHRQPRQDLDYNNESPKPIFLQLELMIHVCHVSCLKTIWAVNPAEEVLWSAASMRDLGSLTIEYNMLAMQKQCCHSAGRTRIICSSHQITHQIVGDDDNGVIWDVTCALRKDFHIVNQVVSVGEKFHHMVFPVMIWRDPVPTHRWAYWKVDQINNDVSSGGTFCKSNMLGLCLLAMKWSAWVWLWLGCMLKCLKGLCDKSKWICRTLWESKFELCYLNQVK